MRAYIRLVLFIGILSMSSNIPLAAQACGCVGCPATIPITNNSFTLDYVVQGLTNDDLSDPSQCVASVNLNFLHNRVQNLVIELISPDGQRIPLVGPYQAFSGSLGGTIGSSWDVDFVRCFPDDVAVPHPGTMEVWNNIDPAWNGFGTAFTGSYYPSENNCLSAFNTGSANGTWQLHVENFEFPPPAGDGSLVDFSIEFCDETGRNCCGADAGLGIGAPPLDACLEDRGFLFFEDVEVNYDEGTPPDTTQYGYLFLVFRDGLLIEVFEDDIDLRDYPAGQYLIYGFSYLLADQAVVDDLTELGTSFSEIQSGSNTICADLTNDDNRFNVTISPPSEERIEFTPICPNDSVFVAGEWRTITDTIVEFIPANDPAADCDIQVTHILELLTAQTDTIQSNICDGSTFDFDGQSLTAAGTYNATFTDENGCDSLVVLELTIENIIRDTLNPQTICFGETLDFNGQTLSESGIYQADLQSESGCDSIVVLELTVADDVRDTLTEQICFGQTFEFDGQQLTDAGTYQADLQSESGCDSIVVLELTVADELRDTLTEQICSGQTFEFDGQQLTDAGTYQADLQSESDCDSIVILELTVADELRDTLIEQICFGQTFEFDGQQLTDAGTYQADLQTSSGCDSIVVLELT
ncbi:MAG: hypothetical protein AAGI23_18095, partial [Bacteroidota bacterium]